MTNHVFSTHGDLIPYGLLVHTTGDGIPSKCSTIEEVSSVAVAEYVKMDIANGVGPHYVISPDGSAVELRDPSKKAWHAAVSAHDRQRFLSGMWETENKVDKSVIDWWHRRWPGTKSPSHLYPAKSPNDSYVGVELVPCGTYDKQTWKPTLAGGRMVFGRFTIDQYYALAELCSDLRHPKEWEEPGRLVGHEDVNPITRPGWDPGDKIGAFDWTLLKNLIRLVG